MFCIYKYDMNVLSKANTLKLVKEEFTLHPDINFIDQFNYII